jgi:hypothetical protein
MPHVTISDITPRENFTVGAGGSSGPFALPSGFVIFTPSADIKFYDDGVQLSYVDPPGSSTQFAFSGTLIDGGYQGGNLTLGGLATSGSVMAAVRDIPIERTTDFSYPSSTLDLEGLNTQLDKLFAIFQDRETDQGRALRQPVSDAVNIDYIPASASRAGKYLAFDSDGDPIVSVGSASTGSVISAYAATFCDDATEAEFKATVNLEIGTDVQAYSALLADIAAITPSLGGLLYGASTTGWALLASGTTGQLLTQGSTGPQWAAPPATAYTVRARSTTTTGYVAASVVSFTHGLGARAKGGQIYLECLVSTGGYTTGQLILESGYYDAAIRGSRLFIDSDTTVKALLSDLSAIPHSGSTASFDPVDTSFGVLIECWT